MEYKGFKTTNITMKKIDENTEIYAATITNSAQYLEISASRLEDMEDTFHNTIDNYILECEKIGLDPFQK